MKKYSKYIRDALCCIIKYSFYYGVNTICTAIKAAMSLQCHIYSEQK